MPSIAGWLEPTVYMGGGGGGRFQILIDPELTLTILRVEAAHIPVYWGPLGVKWGPID